jgi:hypothetical protein
MDGLPGADASIVAFSDGKPDSTFPENAPEHFFEKGMPGRDPGMGSRGGENLKTG